MRDATAVIEKQRRTIGALTEKVAHLQALTDPSPHVTNPVVGDPDLLLKAVDALLAESDAAQKDAAARSVRNAPSHRVKTAGVGSIFRQHGGNVMRALRD